MPTQEEKTVSGVEWAVYCKCAMVRHYKIGGRFVAEMLLDSASWGANMCQCPVSWYDLEDNKEYRCDFCEPDKFCDYCDAQNQASKSETPFKYIGCSSHFGSSYVSSGSCHEVASVLTRSINSCFVFRSNVIVSFDGSNLVGGALIALTQDSRFIIEQVTRRDSLLRRFAEMVKSDIT
jgi:hypothetical protein